MRHEKGPHHMVPGRDWACGIWVESPERAVCVSEDLGRKPIYLKIPGGRGRPVDKDTRDTAVRELFEETGLRVSPDRVELVDQQERHSHTYYLYKVKLDDNEIVGCYDIAKNGEKVHVLGRAELAQRQEEFMQSHRLLLEHNNLWPK